jgi:hypothetical protein
MSQGRKQTRRKIKKNKKNNQRITHYKKIKGGFWPFTMKQDSNQIINDENKSTSVSWFRGLFNSKKNESLMIPDIKSIETSNVPVENIVATENNKNGGKKRRVSKKK